MEDTPFMNKFMISLILLLSLFLLNSCSLGGSRTEMLNRDNSDEIAKARLEEVINVLESRDKDALKAMFSKQALNESADFDSSAADLFDLFQGEVASWEKSSGPTVFESNSHGHKTKKISSYYYVTTDKQKYFFLMDDYPVDTDYPDNVGLYLLLVVKADDRKKIYDGDQKILFDGDQEITRAGIYIPLK